MKAAPFGTLSGRSSERGRWTAADATFSGAVVGGKPLAEPQGESVRAVSGGAFEMNRDRH